eukprot:CCRYP_001879-RA/>CCRYP_001879-RA protein AED:0.19 eAED:0.19 QI:325/1/1/1/1/1/2/629/176
MSTQQHKDEKIQPPYADEHEESFLIEVSSSLPTLSSIQSFLTHPTCGAISLFCGTTRNNFNGKIVTSLSYEGYIPMATKELTKLCLEAKETFGVEKIVSVHIVGECPVGDVSVIVGSCGAHRRETIRCTEFLIDELKARVPIWKKEIYEGDESIWKENVEWHEGRRRRVMRKEERT